MKFQLFGTFVATSVFLLCAIGQTNLSADVITIVDDNTFWQTFTSEIACEEHLDFGAGPGAQDNVGSIDRTGTGSLGSSFDYRVENRDTLAEINNANLIAAAGPNLSGFYLDTNATLDVEDPVAQGGAASTTWGVDSSGSGNNTSVGGIASRNAVVFSFNQQITAFSADLIDFEASAGQEGLLVLSRGGVVIHTEDIAFADGGNGTVHNFGILATTDLAFDSVVLVLGDDNDTTPANGYGGGEFWAASNVKLGIASVPEPTALGMLCFLGLIGSIRRRREH